MDGDDGVPIENDFRQNVIVIIEFRVITLLNICRKLDIAVTQYRDYYKFIII